MLSDAISLGFGHLGLAAEGRSRNGIPRIDRPRLYQSSYPGVVPKVYG